MIRNRYRISSTSVSSEEKNELCSICKYFDLEYSGIFDRDCSHLIANLVSGSQKYRAAIEWGIPVVKMDWLRESMEKKTLLPYNQFALGCFTGFDITLSGIQDPKEKEELIELIKKNGGNYSGTFDSENTTHVITKFASGEKYATALKLGKHVANPNWIQECAKLGAWLPENKFPVGLEKKPKTQSSSSMKSEADEKSKNENNKLIEEQIAKNVIREDQLYLSINRIKILKIFQGFTFAIYGIDDANRLKKIISLILFSGAKYLSDGLLNVTHILVGEKFSEKKMEELEREHPGIKLMKLVWLYDSISSQSLIDPVVFLWRFTPKSSNENALPTDWNSSKKLKTGNEMRIPEILKGKVVCVSEYVDAERDEVKTLTEKLGGIYTERLSMKDPKVNFLICKSKETEKAKKAIAWNIPIYDLTWLRSHFLPPAFN